jgi:hypothetical protein
MLRHLERGGLIAPRGIGTAVVKYNKGISRIPWGPIDFPLGLQKIVSGQGAIQMQNLGIRELNRGAWSP